MTTISTLTATDASKLTLSLNNKTKAALIDKANLVGIATEGLSKSQIILAIVGKSSRIETDKKEFDFSGLYLR